MLYNVINILLTLSVSVHIFRYNMLKIRYCAGKAITESKDTGCWKICSLSVPNNLD